MFSWQSGIICTRPDLQDVLKGMSRFHGNRLRAAFSAKRGSLSWVLLLDFFDLSVSTDRLLLYHSWQILWPFRIRRWRLSIECFQSRGQHLCKFIGTKKSVYIRKEFNSRRIGLGHQHGRCSLFWDTNMAAVTSCENTLKEIRGS